MIEKEEWKVWKDTRRYNKYGNVFNGCLWEVSNLGRVRKDGEIYKLKSDDIGRQYVHQFIRVHRLVAELFIGPIPNGYVVDHIDTDVTNNRVDNLRICTQYENIHNPKTEEHHLTAMRKRSGDIEYSNIMKEAAKKRKSRTGMHRQYNTDGTYKYTSS